LKLFSQKKKKIQNYIFLVGNKYRLRIAWVYLAPKVYLVLKDLRKEIYDMWLNNFVYFHVLVVRFRCSVYWPIG